MRAAMSNGGFAFAVEALPKVFKKPFGTARLRLLFSCHVVALFPHFRCKGRNWLFNESCSGASPSILQK